MFVIFFRSFHVGFRKTRGNDRERKLLPTITRASAHRWICDDRYLSICGRMSEGFVSNFHCTENASDSNICHLTEHFSIVESSLRVTIFIANLLPDYSLATLQIGVIFLTIIMLINKQFSLCKEKTNERKWKHNALHTMNVRLVQRDKMKLLKRL